MTSLLALAERDIPLRRASATRQEARDKELCAQHRETHAGALAAADLLAVFHRHPNLAEEFPSLLAKTEKEYGELLFKLTVIEARLAGEVE